MKFLSRHPVLLPILALLVIAFAGTVLGSRCLWPTEFYHSGSWHPLLGLRVVRIFGTIIIGGSLALSGMVFQAVLRNPLAEPFTLGVSGGAALGATLSFVLGLRALTQYAVPFSALAGALLALGLVLLVSRSGNWCSESLLLSGVIVGTICASLLTYLLSIAQHEELAGVTWWLLGDLQGLDLAMLWPAAAYALLTLLLFRYWAGDLNALSLGEEQAFYLGVNARSLLFLLVLLASLLAAFSVCLAGIVSFCGLIIPHIVRRIYGCDHRKIVFTTFFWGAVFLLLCDLLSRSIFREREIPIGVLTALVGGPIFLLLINRRRRYAA